jgi:hypothetical protein
MLSFLSTASQAQDIIGRLDSNLSNTRTFLQLYLHSVTKQCHLHINSAAIEMRNFLVAVFILLTYQQILHCIKSSRTPIRKWPCQSTLENNGAYVLHVSNREANAAIVLVLSHQACHKDDEHYPQEVQRETCIAIHAHPRCAPRSTSLASKTLSLLLPS